MLWAACFAGRAAADVSSFPDCLCGKQLPPADWAASARFYMRRGTFWTDMLACLPIFAQIAVSATGTSDQLLRLIATLRLLRLIRCVVAGQAACI